MPETGSRKIAIAFPASFAAALFRNGSLRPGALIPRGSDRREDWDTRHADRVAVGRRRRVWRQSAGAVEVRSQRRHPSAAAAQPGLDPQERELQLLRAAR